MNKKAIYDIVFYAFLIIKISIIIFIVKFNLVQDNSIFPKVDNSKFYEVSSFCFFLLFFLEAINDI